MDFKIGDKVKFLEAKNTWRSNYYQQMLGLTGIIESIENNNTNYTKYFIRCYENNILIKSAFGDNFHMVHISDINNYYITMKKHSVRRYII